MEAWCVIVPKDQGEEIRRLLRDRGLLLGNVRIERIGDRVVLPTVERVEVGFPTEERSWEASLVAPRSYRDILEVPESLRGLLPKSFDVIGDIAVIKISPELASFRSEIARAILASNRSVRVVAQDHGVVGVRRVRHVEVLAGETRTTTLHTEFGLRYHVDVARAYFSPRLAAERMRIAEQVHAGETVADPFAGVGPYAILIARRRQPERVIASDANPDAVTLLARNVAANRADRVVVRDGDARDILAEDAPFDRIILDLPHSALDYLPDAMEALKPSGSIHLYGILGVMDRMEHLAEIRGVAEGLRRRVRDVQVREVRGYSPSQDHVAFDVTVGPA